MNEGNPAKLLVIGAGPGGYVCAIRAGQLGVDTVIVEARNLGGVCLNVGCIPSKALIHAAEEFHAPTQLSLAEKPARHIRRARRNSIWRRRSPGRTQIVGRLTSGVFGPAEAGQGQDRQGLGKFRDGKTVAVESETGTQIIRAEAIVIATGSAPVELPFLPFGGPVISSTEALALDELPKRAGRRRRRLYRPGARDGVRQDGRGGDASSRRWPRILPHYDAELTRPVAKRLAELGVKTLTGAKARGLAPKGDALHRRDRGWRELGCPPTRSSSPSDARR